MEKLPMIDDVQQTIVLERLSKFYKSRQFE